VTAPLTSPLRLLAIETASEIGSICLAELGETDVFTVVTSDEGAKLSAWLLPAIDALLQSRGISTARLDAIAFGAGPGAFTGVRTACATAQAIAYATAKPLLTVNCLEAAAELCDEAHVCVVLDARMNELYTANFVRGDDGELRSEYDVVLIATADFQPPTAPTAFVGSGVKYLGGLNDAGAADRTKAIEMNWAKGVARLALRQYAARNFIDPRSAQPLYVRNKVALTEAERAAA
jgi:tRNA threonylcarbamoyladenosine biosynthesis protein TsaB